MFQLGMRGRSTGEWLAHLAGFRFPLPILFDLTGVFEDAERELIVRT
jgi:hypothetical protein